MLFHFSSWYFILKVTILVILWYILWKLNFSERKMTKFCKEPEPLRALWTLKISFMLQRQAISSYLLKPGWACSCWLPEQDSSLRLIFYLRCFHQKTWKNKVVYVTFLCNSHIFVLSDNMTCKLYVHLHILKMTKRGIDKKFMAKSKIKMQVLHVVRTNFTFVTIFSDCNCKQFPTYSNISYLFSAQSSQLLQDSTENPCLLFRELGNCICQHVLH